MWHCWGHGHNYFKCEPNIQSALAAYDECCLVCICTLTAALAAVVRCQRDFLARISVPHMVQYARPLTNKCMHKPVSLGQAVLLPQ